MAAIPVVQAALGPKIATCSLRASSILAGVFDNDSAYPRAYHYYSQIGLSLGTPRSWIISIA